MAFTRGSTDITSYEVVLYSHWIITIQLLKMGISWEAIQSMNGDELNLILGVQMALNQKENDEQARAMAASKATSMHKAMNF